MVKALSFAVWWLSTVLLSLLWGCWAGCSLTALSLLMRMSTALMGVLTVAMVVWAFKSPRKPVNPAAGLLSKAEIAERENRIPFQRGIRR